MGREYYYSHTRAFQARWHPLQTCGNLKLSPLGSSPTPRFPGTVPALTTNTLALGVTLALALTGISAAGDIPSGPRGFKSDVVPFFNSACVRCHGPDKNKGQLTLHTLDGDLSAGQDLQRWESILEMLKSGQMPPDYAKQPSDADRKAVAAWIESGLREYVREASGQPAAPTTRRLTNFEYQNTMRDLLGFELNLAGNLPEDPVTPYHFNNTAEFMLIGPEQMDRYKENARRAMASAIVDPGKPTVHRSLRAWEPRAPRERGMQPDEVGVYGNRRNTAATGANLKSWPTTGEFRIRVKAGAILPPGYTEVPLRLLMGYNLNENSSTLQVEPVGTVRLRNTVDELQVFEFRGRIENYPQQPGRVTPRGVSPPTMTITPQNLFDNGELNDHLRGFDTSWNLATPRVVVRSIEFEAPVTDVWPPEHHTQILFESPLRQSDPDAYVREVLKRFMTRAFRRPVTDDELDRFVKIHAIFASEFDTLEAAMRETLAMVLISPQFLYHTVADGADARQYELASRLSYFLWGSMPDEELFRLAASGKLDDPATLGRQVQRLLADERSGDFADQFTTQWLSLAKMKAVNINQELFPRFLYYVHLGERRGTEVPYRPTIRDYMHEETVGFVAELIRRNAGVASVVDSDFAFLNEPLAAHYGVEGVEGIALRPVPVKPEHHLGGLLTHGSILVGNSTGSAPHPIYRAVWLREAVLGDEVKPPPAEVPALSDSAGDAAEKAVTIKDLLARHRTQERCNDCHARLDPWGIPFERYNAVGRFQPKVPAEGVRIRGFNREADADLAGYRKYLDAVNTIEIQADSRVPHGPEIDGMAELKAYLLRYRKDDIAENMIRRLLTYAIGRGLTYRDRFAVGDLLREAKGNDYKLRDMIVAICRSETFRGVIARRDDP